MPEEAFLGLSTVYSYGRIVENNEEVRNRIDDCGIPIYLTPTSRSIGQERIDFQYDLYDILQERLIKYTPEIESASPDRKDEIISRALDLEKLLDAGLHLGRLSKEFLAEELAFWKEEVANYGPEPVADRLESILSTHGPAPVDIRASISDKTYYSGPDSQVLDDFRMKLDPQTGEVLAEGVAWFRKKASSSSERNDYPIVVTGNSSTYTNRDELNDIIRQKPRRGSSEINLQRPEDAL